MPIMLHCLDGLRVNMYILYKQTSATNFDINNKNILDHKDFLAEMIASLSRKAGRAQMERLDVTAQGTRNQTETNCTVVHPQNTTQLCFCRKNPSLDIFNYVRYTPCHHPTVEAKQNECRYCQYLSILKKNLGEDDNFISKRPRTACKICKVNLCREHFDKFHE